MKNSLVIILIASSLFLSCKEETEVVPEIEIDFSFALTQPNVSPCHLTVKNNSKNYNKVVHWEYVDYYRDGDLLIIKYHYFPNGNEELNREEADILVGWGENQTASIFIEDLNGNVHRKKKPIDKELLEACLAE